MPVPVRSLALADRHAVGGPVSRGLLAAYFAVALLAWFAAAIAAVLAAPDLAAARPLAEAPVLAVHLITLGALPFAVSGAAFHLLPVMLRNDLPSQRALWVALPLLGGGFLVAVGVGRGAGALVWTGASMLTCGLAIVLAELIILVVRAPRGRLLVASRLGIALTCAHVVAAFSIGAVAFDHDGPFAGLSYERWLLIHLHIALVGWIALLVVSVGRNLAPMLALAPAAPRRRLPADELGLVTALWLLLLGLGVRSRLLTLVGAIALVVVLGHFVVLIVRTMRTRRGALEAPLAHLVVGGFFLAEAAVAGVTAAAGVGGRRLVLAYVVALLVGWAGGVVLGHIGKLLALSIWVWWPPGPRPRQSALYLRPLGLVEAALFAAGAEAIVVGVLVTDTRVVRAGAVTLACSALVALAGAALSWRRRART